MLYRLSISFLIKGDILSLNLVMSILSTALRTLDLVSGQFFTISFSASMHFLTTTGFLSFSKASICGVDLATFPSLSHLERDAIIMMPLVL